MRIGRQNTLRALRPRYPTHNDTVHLSKKRSFGLKMTAFQRAARGRRVLGVPRSSAEMA